MQSDVAVESITFKSWFNISKYDISSYFIAFGSSFGSAEYTPSIVFASNITSESVSAALSAAPVSVEKYGFPVPQENITTLPLSKCFIAYLFMYGSAISLISIAVWSLVYIPLASNASWRANAFIDVASIPI